MYKIALRYVYIFLKIYGINPIRKKIFLCEDFLDIDGKNLFFNEKAYHINSINRYVADFIRVFNSKRRRIFALDFGDRDLLTEEVNAAWFFR